ncbi:hypothetical protein HELRODRAFT_176772 [Helobdella robusta]|uniref:Methionine--tRNA ligase, cytoplasmic n=1 Tax=Helobdella robusta TaxID=6412 RepID=T1FAW5_HELRO|nr:hypothetical protein HELRODRAFT_176772 [Helobdella robusta]ESN99607.1 hypothetical protein HELRODRAFT_176772 [Helobdella robusta]
MEGHKNINSDILVSPPVRVSPGNITPSEMKLYLEKGNLESCKVFLAYKLSQPLVHQTLLTHAGPSSTFTDESLADLKNILLESNKFLSNKKDLANHCTNPNVLTLSEMNIDAKDRGHVHSSTPTTEPNASDEELKFLSDIFENSAESSCPTKLRRKRTAPILPHEGDHNLLVTSALPYVNNVPHLGNIIGCVLSSDVFVRYARLRDYNVLFVCGTDEYGTATEAKALEEGLTPKQICDKYHEVHKSIYDWFDISFDRFGRTTNRHQTKIAQDIFWDLYNNGYILKDSVEQFLCENCDRFLADRFVEGTCPYCLYEDARGDQCDKCGKLINAIDLKNPQCKVCRSTPCIRQSNHLFLDLPTLEPRLSSHLDRAMERGIWSTNAKTITRSWIRDGLKPRCVSRDLKWGTPVPLEGYQNKVFYVWYDAPIGYISITADYIDEWKKCKFSKSKKYGVFGDNAVEAGLPADIFRFYLLFIRPESQDSAFTWDDFMLKNNSELLNNLGNFVNRALMFLANNFGGKVQKVKLTPDDKKFIMNVSHELGSYIQNMEHVRLRDGLRNILSISSLGNQYMQSNKPWVLIKGCNDDKLRAGSVCSLAANVVHLIATLLHPFMPKTSTAMLQQLNVATNTAAAACTAADADDVTNGHQFVLDEHFRCYLKDGHCVGEVKPLFQKIEQSHINELKIKFSGKQQQQQQQQQMNGTVEGMDESSLSLKIQHQGDVVRKLKEQKAEKTKIDEEVKVLLKLKAHLSAISGKPMPASAPVSKKAKGKNPK